MTPPSDVVVAPVARARRRAMVDFAQLTKPRVLVMVLVTTMVGYYVGLVRPPEYVQMLNVLVGTLLAAGGALALNEYGERDLDGRMARTRLRPLPDGRLQPLEALLFGVTITVAGVAWLAAFVNGAAAAVTAVTVVLYLFAYTPLKLRTPLCTLVGAVPGALPPLTGWVAARDAFAAGGWALFAILFFWQLPHTLAIARLYRDDYARAGVRVLPVVDAGGTATERLSVVACLALLAVSVVPAVVGLAGAAYVAGALVLGVALAALALRQALAPSTASARRVLFATLLYLPVLLALLAFGKR